jgi:putative membrane-bound dehydrogenase-like protein
LPFKLPPGFVAERVAGPPVVEYPMAANFDETGRLFVAHAAGRNVRSAEVLLKELPNSIRLLEPADNRGQFNKFVVFADKMTFPTGALWYDGAFYCCSAPYLWKMQDTKRVGLADRRQELVGKFDWDGHAGDIKGPFLGPDGRLYWTDGLMGHRVVRRDGSVLEGRAARIWRCNTDGDDIEVICGGGMDNPVMMTFTAEGEPLASSTLLNNYPARYDGIIYCLDGGVYPHHASMIAEFKRTGDLLPPVANLGHVSPSGLMRYRSTALGAEYRDNLFVTHYNTHKVQRLILKRDGAGFQVSAEDFLVSDSEHFHPTCVLEDADGSLLVVDTGGWITVACYVSLLKPGAKGGIYRIRRERAPTATGGFPFPSGHAAKTSHVGVAETISDPRGLALKWDELAATELAKLLDDPRWVVRDRAILQLAKRGTSAAPALREILQVSQSVQARRNAVWAATRMDSRDALVIPRAALDDQDMSVRLAAAHAVGLHRDAEALPRLCKMVVHDTPALRRQAATALGRIRRASAVQALLAALAKPAASAPALKPDRFLEHALIYALIQIDDRDATLKGLRDRSPVVQRGALIALDQMDHGKLTEDLVTPLLDTDDPLLQKTALRVVSARSWADQAAGLLGQWLNQQTLPGERQESLREALLALCHAPAIHQLVAQKLRQEQTPLPTRLLLLETLSQVPLDKLPATWIAEIGSSLQYADARVARQAVATIRAKSITEFDGILLGLAMDKKKPSELRATALAAAAPRLPGLEPALFDFLVGRLDQAMPPLARLEAAAALSSVPLEESQLKTLARVVAHAGALEMPPLLAAFERSKEPAMGRLLVAALDKSPGLASVAPEALRRTLKAYPDEVRQAARPLFKRLEVDLEKQKAHLAELAPVLKQGDAGRGQDVFFGSKASCATCHTAKGQGGQVGPDLSKIGAIRTGRELLESIVFPSAGFARGYEPFVVELKSGKSYTGILKRETAEAIYLLTVDRASPLLSGNAARTTNVGVAETRIPRATIEALEPGKVSIMPQGLDAQLCRQELGDLIAFLLSLK